jgi:hypothetical protein
MKQCQLLTICDISKHVHFFYFLFILFFKFFRRRYNVTQDHLETALDGINTLGLMAGGYRQLCGKFSTGTVDNPDSSQN